LLFALVSALVKTLRTRVIFEEVPKFPCAVVFWHGNMLLLPFAMKRFANKVSILISRHRDGQVVSEVVEKLGFSTIRGSVGVKKGGTFAFLRMLKTIQEGRAVAITPDGPKGPARIVKEGVGEFGIKARVPIYPLTFCASRFINLSSWDRFLVPLPFSKCCVILGKPIIPEPTDDRYSLSRKIERALNLLEEKCRREL